MQHHPQRPPVDGARVALAGDHLWRHVLRRADERRRPDLLLATTEIHQLRRALEIQQHVLGLQIPVHDPSPVQVFQAQRYGTREELRLQLAQRPNLAQSIEEVTASQELGEEINVLLVLKCLDELDEARVVALGVDVPFHDDGLLLVALDDVPLLHAFQSVQRLLLSLWVHEAHDAESAPPDHRFALQVPHLDVEVLQMHAALKLLAEHAHDVEECVVVQTQATAILQGLARGGPHLREQQAALPEIVPTPQIPQRHVVFLDDDGAASDEEKMFGWVALLHDHLASAEALLLESSHDSVDLLLAQVFEQEDVRQDRLDLVHPANVHDGLAQSRQSRNVREPVHADLPRRDCERRHGHAVEELGLVTEPHAVCEEHVGPRLGVEVVAAEHEVAILPQPALDLRAHGDLAVDDDDQLRRVAGSCDDLSALEDSVLCGADEAVLLLFGEKPEKLSIGRLSGQAVEQILERTAAEDVLDAVGQLPQ
mmetsp:Transcript_103805/g.317915  ORF Transcript_103805/g.317915 Transcript_103805/m.317915 type:complete len:482 (-) Transcript_103805:959-2404(-)